MKGGRKTQLIMLITAFGLVLAGFILLAAEMFKAIEAIKLFGQLNLGIVLIVVGGILTFLAPKPNRGKKKKKYRGY